MLRFKTPTSSSSIAGTVPSSSSACAPQLATTAEGVGDLFGHDIEDLKKPLKHGEGGGPAVEFEVKVRKTFTHERAKGYTHVLYSIFQSKADMNTYASHPLHVAVLNKYKPLIEDVMAVDIDVSEELTVS
eukprot:GHVS01060435.1.p1 GENE.GHVS01060435.1~~GHVS01060435.1.p1  ORF type:complete len:130 (+),score=27.12 GHVS01060435.1:1-390(+)